MQHLRSGIISLWEGREHTDVTLIVDGTHIPAHRVILASQSEYFDRLLFGEMREAHPGAEIPLQDTPLEAFQLLMKYAYSGSLEITTAKLQVCIMFNYNFAAVISPSSLSFISLHFMCMNFCVSTADNFLNVHNEPSDM